MSFPIRTKVVEFSKPGKHSQRIQVRPPLHKRTKTQLNSAKLKPNADYYQHFYPVSSMANKIKNIGLTVSRNTQKRRLSICEINEMPNELINPRIRKAKPQSHGYFAKEKFNSIFTSNEASPLEISRNRNISLRSSIKALLEINIKHGSPLGKQRQHPRINSSANHKDFEVGIKKIIKTQSENINDINNCVCVQTDEIDAVFVENDELGML